MDKTFVESLLLYFLKQAKSKNVHNCNQSNQCCILNVKYKLIRPIDDTRTHFRDFISSIVAIKQSFN